jgi:8-oxo-dGTP pyrophosphatase MutT (NUDIX family)
MIKEIKDYHGNQIEVIWNDSPNFENLAPITQIYGLCFDKAGKLMIIKTTKNWCLPGGKPENEETPEETLIREVNEEASIEIENITPLGYQIVKTLEDNKEIYQLRYFALIKNINSQKVDPATGIIPDRILIKPEEFHEYCNWGKIGDEIVNKAKEVFDNLKQ